MRHGDRQMDVREAIVLLALILSLAGAGVHSDPTHVLERLDALVATTR